MKIQEKKRTGSNPSCGYTGYQTGPIFAYRLDAVLKEIIEENKEKNSSL